MTLTNMDRQLSRVSSQTTEQASIHQSHVAFYGFALYVSSFILFIAYISWAAVPESLLCNLGITYYPSRSWAITIPAFLIVAILFLLFIHTCVSLMITPTLSSSTVYTDPSSRPMSREDIMIQNDCIPRLYDLPIELINVLLYNE
jgi:phosphatidylinositol glycan class P protein